MAIVAPSVPWCVFGDGGDYDVTLADYTGIVVLQAEHSGNIASVDGVSTRRYPVRVMRYAHRNLSRST